jgi:hypothetical protein
MTYTYVCLYVHTSPPDNAAYQPPTGEWKDHMFNCFAQTSPSCKLYTYV